MSSYRRELDSGVGSDARENQLDLAHADRRVPDEQHALILLKPAGDELASACGGEFVKITSV